MKQWFEIKTPARGGRMDRREREALDDHITGHGGDDQLRQGVEEDEDAAAMRQPFHQFQRDVRNASHLGYEAALQRAIEAAEDGERAMGEGTPELISSYAHMAQAWAAVARARAAGIW